MIQLTESDVNKIQNAVSEVIEHLAAGTKRVDVEIDIVRQHKKARATGYWIGDLLRIDVKL